MKSISKIAMGIAPSATLAIDSMAKDMKASGIDVIGFGAGEPDFDTPDYIKEAGIAAIRENRTRYTPAAGIMPLKKAICDCLKRDISVEYEPSQICVSNGAKHIIYVALQSIINPGDEVILPAPYWVSYYEAIKMCGGVPVIVETTEEQRFKMSPEQLERAVTEKTKCLILTNPSNPTGMVYSKEELIPIRDVIIKHDLYVLSDEIYFALTYSGSYTSIASLDDDIKEHTILINGMSKSYAMTGWRIGFAAANKKIIKVMANYLSHSTGSPCTISQYASLGAMLADSTVTSYMKKAFNERRLYFVDRVNNIDGVSCLVPDGAFYIFMNIKEQIGKTLHGMKIENSDDFASCLLKNGLVAVVPGTAFGADGYVRWSYATSMENIKEGLDRLEEFLKN